MERWILFGLRVLLDDLTIPHEKQASNPTDRQVGIGDGERGPLSQGFSGDYGGRETMPCVRTYVRIT